MDVKCFKIECLTNLHVGSGENNYNIIDKTVEKDPILQVPTIHASGVKGALREHLKAQDCGRIDEIFGRASAKDDTAFAPGQVKILSANLLAMPMRASDGKAFYYMVSNEELLNTFHHLNKSFSINISIDPICTTQVEAEGKICQLCQTSGENNPIPGTALAMMDAADFRNVYLPVVARNRIHEHKNLWYEEFVPHKSVFYFYAISHDTELLETFSEEICKTPVQFGGNASVGYGYTKISLIGGSAK